MGEQRVPRVEVGKRHRIIERYPSGTVATYEGIVTSLRRDGDVARFGGGDAVAYTRDYAGVTVTVERLPDPEPEWQPGDVVVTGKHTLLLPPTPTSGPAFTRTPWWRCSCGEAHSPSEMSADWRAGNVRHVLRDGKPVGGAA